jgi:Holliday junction resolvasome RuvABC endonuclease subunit
MGIDPSSSVIGLAVVDQGGELVWHEAWETGLVGTKEPELVATAMGNLRVQLMERMAYYKPEIIVIEQLAVAQSLNTVRAIMYFEATAMLAWKEYESFNSFAPHLFKPVATSMRAKVFGKGNLSKEQTSQIIRKALGKEEMHLPTPRSRKEVPVFTDDECDAYAYGCYGVEFSLKPVAQEMGFVAA